MHRSRIRFGEGQVLQLRVELAGITPVIWRRVVVSDRASLHELHEIVQRSLGRDAGLSYSFLVDGVRYQGPDRDGRSPRAADHVSLQSLELHVGARVMHAVDEASAAWNHVIAVEQSTPRLVGQRVPSCLAGAGAAPPPECSGPEEFRQLLASLDDPLDPRAAEWRNWLPDDFDPAWADVAKINAALAKVPKHRPAA